MKYKNKKYKFKKRKLLEAKNEYLIF